MTQAIQPIIFFNKNAADYDFPAVTVVSSEGDTSAPFVQNRSNAYGWITTGSVDANNTTLTINFNALVNLTDLLLVKHNFKNFTIKYWNGAAWVDFSTPINVAGYAANFSRFTFTEVQTTQVQLTVLGTQVPNSDKRLSQFIATSIIGQLTGWPIIKSPDFNLNKQLNTMISGKTAVGVNMGGFSVKLTVTNWKSAADLAIVETLYNYGEGFLVWLCGGNEDQFSSIRQGYRLIDLYLMQTVNDFQPEWADGLYVTGMAIEIDLSESVT